MSRPKEEYLKGLPKAELHVHLEGSVTAARLSALARKHKTDLKDAPAGEISDKLFRYKDFAAFLDAYRVVCEHLREVEDYLAVLDEMAEAWESQNVQYAEVIFSPSIADRFERDAEGILDALLERSRAIEGESGIRVRWILDCVRQWGPKEAQRTAELAVSRRPRGVVALGLGGDENSVPMADFAHAFAWAKANQLFIHVHAGETGGPEQVWDALRVLGANRIGHGIQAARDAKLMEYLRERAVGLDVCLTSNLQTHAWQPISTNPFGLLFKRGVPVSINTDDPGLFNTTLVGEYLLATENFGLSFDDVNRLALQGLHSAFLPHETRMELMQRFTNEIHAGGEPRRQ